MTDRHDGGPAFPRNGQSHLDTKDGMSLRDWFAGQALVADAMWKQGSEYEYNRFFGEQSGVHMEELAARRAYAVADAMLAARSEAKP